VSFSNITGTSATASWGASTDNSTCFGYDWRLNGGAWNWVGAQTSVGLTNLAFGTTYTFDVRARDCMNNASAPRSSQFTTSQPAWITIAATTSVLAQYQTRYACYEEFNGSIPYYHAWCDLIVPPWGNVWFWEESAAGYEIWADGYQSRLQVREDYLPPPP
jgi:hypothetical protein